MRYDDSVAEILAFHREMLADRTRMDAFFRAIMTAVEPGDVVLDIGTGTGVLAYFACMAGARRVYAVEQGAVGDLALELVRRNGYGGRVELLRDWSTAVELPEPADVLVTETIGNAGFEEGILGWVADARRRLLKPGGTVIPRRVCLVAAVVDDAHDYVEVEQWSVPRRGLDFSPGRARAARELWSVDFSPVHLLAEPGLVAGVDLAAPAIATEVSGGGVAVARRDGVAHGLGCWFEADLAAGVTLTTAPPNSALSWSHVLLPLLEPIPVAAGRELRWAIRVADNGATWSWEVQPG